MMNDADTSKPFTIGLNEVGLGIPVPRWLCHRMVQLVGQQNAERILSTGTLVTTGEAERIGLVDKAVSSMEELSQEATQRLEKLLVGVHEAPQVETLKYLRDDSSQQLQKLMTNDLDGLWNYLGNEKFREGIRAYLAKLSKKK